MLKVAMLLLLSHTLMSEDGCIIGNWRCGDKCIHRVHTCECVDPLTGGRNFSESDQVWCCPSEPCEDREMGWSEVGAGASCTGTTIPLTQSCNGSCNFYPDDYTRSSVRSHMPDMCSDVCMEEVEVCKGGGRCGEEREWCRSEEMRNKTCPWSNTNFFYDRCIGDMPGQCIDPGDFSDGDTMQCSDRSDEDPFQEAAPPIDTSLLQKCNSSYSGRPGLKCGEEEDCIRIDKWCRGYQTPCPALGVNRTISDDELCGNYTFWSDVECDSGHSRCSGRNSGQCVPGLCDEGNLVSCCIDGSNHYPSLNTCSTITCTVNFTLCLNYTLDDWNKGCNEEVEYSEVRCLSELSMCDTHPQCQSGEDELNCEEEYRKKGYFTDTAMFKCQSPHHNDGSSAATVYIWATRCDGNSECWMGLDESDCQVGMKITLVILGKVLEF